MRAFSLVALVLLAACECAPPSPPQAPEAALVRRLGDPYEQAPARGSVTDLVRAKAILDAVSHDLGYGDLPGRTLEARAGADWVRRTTMFLAHGGDDQIHAAWLDVHSAIVEGYQLPMELKAELRMAEARMLDFLRLKPVPKAVRDVELAELAWAFLQLGTYRPPQPQPPDVDGGR